MPMGSLEHDETPFPAANEPADGGEARKARAAEVSKGEDVERRGQATAETSMVDPLDSSEEKPKKKPARAKKKGEGGRPNNVRKIRIENMMSKAELARRANLSVLTVDRVEKGFGCRVNTKRKILEALGLSLADRIRVFGEEE
jgi:DNA-binding XRE family transcriptional regulator